MDNPLTIGIVGAVAFVVVMALILWGVHAYKAKQGPTPEPTKESWISGIASKGLGALPGGFLTNDGTTVTLPLPFATATPVARRWRMGILALVSIALAAAVWYVAAQQIGLLVYKACLITMAGALGYLVDRTVFPDSRPHLFEDVNVRWKYEARRALIIAAALLTCGLGA